MKWYKPEDALPVNGTLVAVATKTQYSQNVQINVDGFMVLWHIRNGEFQYCGDKVLYWTPLPEFPGEQ